MKPIVNLFLVIAMALFLGVTAFCIADWATVINQYELPHWLPWPVAPIGTFVSAFLCIACGVTLIEINES